MTFADLAITIQVIFSVEAITVPGVIARYDVRRDWHYDVRLFGYYNTGDFLSYYSTSIRRDCQRTTFAVIGIMTLAVIGYYDNRRSMTFAVIGYYNTGMTS